MNVNTYFHEALLNFSASKQRTFLALLGIIIGVGSVITMLSIGQSYNIETIKQFKDLGTDILFIQKEINIINNSSEKKRAPALKLKDILDLHTYCSAILYVAPYNNVSGTVSSSGYLMENIYVVGVTESFFKLNKFRVKKGRLLSDSDKQNQFCVVGDTICQQIQSKGIKDCIGEKIRINENIMIVAGVLNNLFTAPMHNFDANKSIFIPIVKATSMNRDDDTFIIMIKIKPDVNTSEAKIQISNYLSMMKRASIYKIETPEELIATMKKQLNMITTFLGIIGGISLLVGGIGIMNVMLISVLERQREIGLRRALGAKRSDIKKQFLIESILLCVIGGLVGMLLGVVATYIISKLLEWAFNIFVYILCFGCSLSLIVGVFFGYYPANKAASLDPIVALRSE